MKKLIAIDGNSLLFRAYYALPQMTASDGTPTGALHGFLSMLLKLVDQKPDYLAVAFDRKGPTFRHLEYDAYKAGRRETPEDLIKQMPLLQSILQEMGIQVITLERYEADDILGTLSKRCEDAGLSALLVTGDRDALQLVSGQTHVLMTKKGISDTVEYTPEVLMEQYGLKPDQMRDLKGLMGDNSDNIPGIPGVGEKTALKLLNEYGSLEQVLENGASIKGKLGERVRENADLARMSYRIGTIEREAPVKESLTECTFVPENLSKAKKTLLKLELRSIAQRLPGDDSAFDGDLHSSSKVTAKKIEIAAPQDLLKMAEDLKKAESLCLDYDGAFTISAVPEVYYEIAQGGDLFSSFLPPEAVWKALQPTLEDTAVKKIVFDSKRLRHILRGHGIELNGSVFDLMIADYLINSVHPSGSLKALAERRLHTDQVNASQLHTMAIGMEKELQELDLDALYHNMEYPLSKVLFSMEVEGFLVDAEILKHLQGQFEEQANRLSQEIYELAGEKFNILSPKQLGVILFEKMGLPAGKKTKTGYSTDADTLERLADENPIVSKILEYRFVAKLKSTFLDALLSARGKDGRIHTQFNQCVTATGRISSTEPNLQNIPVRTSQGREIRKAFVASPGHVLVGADYSQIELRILAHISNDEGMIAAFNSGEDIHRRTASEVFGVPFDAVSGELRSAAKAVNFGIVYGISDFGLSKNLNIPVKKAASYIRQYLDRYQDVQAFMKNSVQEGKERGYAITLFHRRRPLPELSSGNYNTRSFGERVAMNMPIQGSAADIIKLAMVQVSRSLEEKGLKAKLVLQIHDELIVDTPEDEVEAVMELVRSSMENVVKLRVPLEADVKKGHSWFDTK